MPFDNDDPEIRAGAAVAFEEIGLEARIAVPELTKALNNENHYVLSRAKQVLSVLQSVEVQNSRYHLY